VRDPDSSYVDRRALTGHKKRKTRGGPDRVAVWANPQRLREDDHAARRQLPAITDKQTTPGPEHHREAGFRGIAVCFCFWSAGKEAAKRRAWATINKGGGTAAATRARLGEDAAVPMAQVCPRKAAAGLADRGRQGLRERPAAGKIRVRRKRRRHASKNNYAGRGGNRAKAARNEIEIALRRPARPRQAAGREQNRRPHWRSEVRRSRQLGGRAAETEKPCPSWGPAPSARAGSSARPGLDALGGNRHRPRADAEA